MSHIAASLDSQTAAGINWSAYFVRWPFLELDCAFRFCLPKLNFPSVLPYEHAKHRTDTQRCSALAFVSARLANTRRLEYTRIERMAKALRQRKALVLFEMRSLSLSRKPNGSSSLRGDAQGSDALSLRLLCTQANTLHSLTASAFTVKAAIRSIDSVFKCLISRQSGL